MTNNYTIEKSIVIVPYEVNRDDRTDKFSAAGTKNAVISNAAEGTFYFTKNSTEQIILTGSWFDEDPEVNPLHLVKEEGEWKLNNTEDITLGYINGSKFLNDKGDIIFPDQGLEVPPRPEGGFPGKSIQIARIDDSNNITWTQISEVQDFYHCVAVHDIDGNGFNDIFSVSFDYFYIWKQTSDNVFEQTNVIKTDRASAIGIADLDGNGDPEMIIGTYNEYYGTKSKFMIYSDDLESLATASELTPIFSQELEDQSMGAESFKFHDLDGNGFKDIIISLEKGNDSRLVIWMNDGDFNFRKTTTIDLPNSIFYRVAYDLIDADSDGDKDLILSGSQNFNSAGNLKIHDMIYINEAGVFSKYDIPIIVEGEYWFQSFTRAYERDDELIFINFQSETMPELQITEIIPTIEKAAKYKLSLTADSSKNILEDHSDSVLSGTLNFNAGENIIILDGQAKNYRGLEGDDTYFVSQLLPKSGKVSITDTEGTNTIQIPYNTYVDKTLFTKNAARLTLEDGREITINSADKFSYNVGGNVTDGTAGVDLTYTEFARSFGVADILDSSGAQTGVISDMYII